MTTTCDEISCPISKKFSDRDPLINKRIPSELIFWKIKH